MVLRISILFFVSVFLSESSLYLQNKRAADKVFKGLWKETGFRVLPTKPVDNFHGQLFEIFDTENNRLAYTIFDEALGKVANFTYLVVFTTDGNILQAAVLKYRENYGGEIASKRFLKQFIGKRAGQGMEYPSNIDGISGATISVQSITAGIKRNSKELSGYLINKE